MFLLAVKRYSKGTLGLQLWFCLHPFFFSYQLSLLLCQATEGNKLWECAQDLTGVVISSWLAEWAKSSSWTSICLYWIDIWLWSPASPYSGMYSISQNGEKTIRNRTSAVRKKHNLSVARSWRQCFGSAQATFFRTLKTLHQLARATFMSSWRNYASF